MSQAQSRAGNIIESNQEEMYNASPYESHAYYKTNPDYLYLIGRLHGLSPPDYKTARVLELGCAGGGNLAPFAYAFPQSKCYGIDIAETQLKDAEILKKKLNIKNVEFAHRNIMDLSKEKDGEFDYIMCHGILAWVPLPVQDKILEICSTMLTPEGMAVISYNALPGWNFVRSIREMMQYETRNDKDIKTKVRKAKNLLNFLTRNASGAAAGYSPVLAVENQVLSNTVEDFVLHDHLGEINDPLYLYEFVEKIEKHGLHYVSDSDLNCQYMKLLSEEAQAYLLKIPDRTKRLQYIDFIHNVRFHTSIITRSKKPVTDTHNRDFIFDYCLVLDAEPEKEDPDLTGKVGFHKPKHPHIHFSLEDKYCSRLLLEMYYHGPHPVKLEQIIAQIVEEEDEDSAEAYRQAARKSFPDLIYIGFMQLYAEPALSVNTLSDQPRAYEFTRTLAALRPDTAQIMNAHRMMGASEKFVNLVISYCDGEHTHEQISKKMLEHLKNGEIKVMDSNSLPIEDPVQQKLSLDSMVFNTLTGLTKGGAFVG